jgi:FkbM family methyltransferase
LRIKLPSPAGTLTFLLAWAVPWRPAFAARSLSGKKFFVNHRDAIGRHVAKYGMHEPLVTAWMARFLELTTDALVIDIGANVGWHAIHAAAHPNVKQVVAFEPDLFNAWLLERNAAANRACRIIIDTRALGSAQGIAKLYRYKMSNAGRHSLATNHGFGSRDVPLTTLDDALNEHGFGEQRVALIKMDVEGFEPAVLAGAALTLGRTDVLLMEYSPDWSGAAGLSAGDALDRLSGLGFLPYVLSARGGTAPTEYDELKRFSGSLDVVFVHQSQVGALVTCLGERSSSPMSLQTIAEENKRVK